MKLPLIPTDKANHFIYGFVIYILSNLIFDNFYSLFIVIIIAFLKEIYDEKLKEGAFDVLDAIATIVPALIMYLLC